MPNKIILKNNLSKLQNDEASKKMQADAKRKMLWNFQKSRIEVPKEEKPKEENQDITEDKEK